ncbi:MAG TPA: hypothetical protein VMT98_06580 [Verrucomicrobiae bacterium]|nr:hypothetical protein [Verrucomicrobiae bacterium]
MAQNAQPHCQEPGLRPVTDLVLAEQIVIWMLRRYRAGGERLEGLAGTFRQIFGLGGVETGLAAAGMLIGALERHGRRTESRPRPPATETIGAANDSGIHRIYLSHTELSVLRLIAAAQRNDSLTAAAVAAWLVRPAGQGQMLDGALAFAACLTAAGQHLPAEAEAPVQPATPNSAVLGSAYQTADLQPDEKLVLVAMRLWVRRAMQNECGGPVLYRHLADHGAAEAAPGLHGMLYNLGTAARRPIDMRCPNCTGLSPDEARLIHALASAQAARDDAVLDVMLELLAPAAARLTVEPARGAARALAISGVALPLRDWDFTTLALEAAPSAEPSPLQADGFDCESSCDEEAGRGRPRVLH